MNVHVFMNELDQKDYWYPRKIINCENLCIKSMGSCPLVISHILAEFHPEWATYTTLHNHFSLINGLSKSAQTITVGFVKLLSSHPIHIVVWGNFPFNLSLIMLIVFFLFYVTQYTLDMLYERYLANSDSFRQGSTLTFFLGGPIGPLK